MADFFDKESEDKKKDDSKEEKNSNPVNSFFEDSSDGKKMSFIDHLDELRKRLLVVMIIFVVAFIAFYPFHSKILEFLNLSFLDNELVFLEVMEPFLVNVKISFFCAVITASPFLAYQVAVFISPALTSKIKKYMIVILIMFFILFAAGFYFGYKLLIPSAMKWLISQGSNLEPTISVSRYVSFVGWFLVGAGLAFEIPLVLLFFIKAGVLKTATLRKQWRIVYIIILLLSALITPDWSPVTMAVLAIPMILLYELSLLLAKIFK